MTDSSKASMPSTQTKTTFSKSKGPIRWEAVLPATIITGLLLGYFILFFDLHIKKVIELIGYSIAGAEVNVDKVETHFTTASISISGIQITNPERPSHNLLSIGEIKFELLWDALLRAKFVVNLAAVRQIQLDSVRKKVGRVKPPELKSNEPSLVEKEAKKLAQEALDRAKNDYAENVLGDIANLLSGEQGEDQFKNIQNNLKSKALLSEIQSKLTIQQTEWKSKFDSLSKKDYVRVYNEELKRIKTSDFKTPDEIKKSLNQAEALVNEIDKDLETVTATTTELNQTINSFNEQFNVLEASIQTDTQNLKAHFKIPQIDAEAISQNLFKRYTRPYLAQIERYQNFSQKYLPPNLLKKKNEDTQPDEPAVIPHPRDRGTVYEFGKLNSYPLVWIKKVEISSKATPSIPASGDIAGEVLDISSNQSLTHKPIQLNIKGDFPQLQIKGVEAHVVINHTQIPHKESLRARVESYPVENTRFVSSKDFEFGFNKATGTSALEASYSNKNIQFSFENSYKNLDSVVQASQKEINEILKTIINPIPTWTINASAEGQWPHLPVHIVSNLGGEISRGFDRLLQEKIKEAQNRIKQIIDDNINKEKVRLQTEYFKIKAQFEGEFTKLKQNMSQQKAELDNTVKRIQSEESKKAQRKVEDEIKKQIGPDANKKLDDLKKKLKF